MKIAIYSPYLDTLGGGERYMMTIGESLVSNNQVDILLDSNLYLQDTEKLLVNLADRFGLNLEGVNMVRAPVGQGSNVLERAVFLTKYDVLIYLTDGSFFYPTSTKNILHIQSPIIGQGKNMWGKLKLSGWDLIIYNSEFTQKNCQKYWNLKSEVVYPPVDVERIKPLKKEKSILSVGRFFGFLRDKKHEALIKAFKKIYSNKKFSDWSLNLVGSAGDGDKAYIDELREMSKGLPIKFYPNLNYNDLIQLYGESSLYWHAMGYEEEDPTKMEHFGITTVEAMAGGAVPVVINKGGQTEIVENGKNGFLWDNLKELEDLTLKLVSDGDLRGRLSKQAVLKSKAFSKENFKEKILKLAIT